MSSEYTASGNPRGSADLAGAPDPAGPLSRPFARVTASNRDRPRRSFILAGAAVVALLGGAAVAVGASGSATPANAAVASVSQAPWPSGSHHGSGYSGGMAGFGVGPGGGPSLQHGQIVLGKTGGGFQTVDIQSGAVTAVSTSSITVKSADGFTHSYAITGSTNVDAQRDGIGSVKVGDQAFVIAAVSGRTSTAAKIIDTTQLKQSHQQFW